MAAYYFVDVREIPDSAKMHDDRARINAVVARFDECCVAVGDHFRARRILPAGLPCHDRVSHSGGRSLRVRLRRIP